MVLRWYAGSYYPDEWFWLFIPIYTRATHREDENETLQGKNNNDQGILFYVDAGMSYMLFLGFKTLLWWYFSTSRLSSYCNYLSTSKNTIIMWPSTVYHLRIQLYFLFIVQSPPMLIFPYFSFIVSMLFCFKFIRLFGKHLDKDVTKLVGFQRTKKWQKTQIL